MEFKPFSAPYAPAVAPMRPHGRTNGLAPRGATNEITLAVPWNDGTTGATYCLDLFHSDRQTLVYSSEGVVQPGSDDKSCPVRAECPQHVAPEHVGADPTVR